MTIKFVGLHAHSVAGSIFDAIGYPDAHMNYCFQNGGDALALTDHGNMNGLAAQVLHAKKMQAEGKNFKPIFGVEAYFTTSVKEWRGAYDEAMADKKKARATKKTAQSGATTEDEGNTKAAQPILKRRRHLILLAQNQVGLNNLFKLISKSYTEEYFYRYPRMDYDLLREHSEGIIAASACLGGVYAGNYWENREEGSEAVLEAMRETTREMVSIFGDRWYAELQWNNIPEQHELNKYIIQIAKEFDLKMISTADSHYPDPDAWKDREMYKRLGWLGRGTPSWGEGSELPSGVEEIGYELYPKNGDQMWESYKNYCKSAGFEYDDDLVMDSITETYDIAHNRIESFFPDTTVRLPDFVVPADSTATQALVNYALEGLRQRSLHENSEYMERLKHELNVIDDRGFSKYFLTMKAIADEATTQMLAGPGRGSAAGSLVAYSLGITQVDPIKHGLLFSRFLRSDATDYPDIDYDVSDSMALKERLVEMWGEDTVAPISNWNTLQLKSLIKDISKLHGIPFPEVNSVTSTMIREATPAAKQRHGIKAGVYVPTWEEVIEFSPTLQSFLTRHPEVHARVEGLVGQVRSCSRHAGGVVVAENLDQYMPLINSGGVRQSPWAEGQNVRHLEPMGFIKFDLLGLSTLKMMEGCIEHILRRHHGVAEPTFEQVREYYNEKLHPDTINMSDREVYENVFHAGRWAGIFQFTEQGAQGFCKKAKPESIVDISAVTSIFRPGPLSAGVDTDYVEAKTHPQYVSYLSEDAREITEETFGFLIFQEQIALLAHKLGGLTLDEGNMLRKVLTKKGTGKGGIKTKLRVKFVDGCKANGIDSDAANSLWDKFEFFSGYGFNKSHAVSYSIISFQCAWLWNYYPAEWMAAFLDKEPESRKEKAINIAKKYGFDIAPLDINKSGTVWEISDDGKTLIQPLTSIKGLGMSAIEQILDNRPFTNAEDLLFREGVSYSKFNKKALDALCRGGALDNIIDDRFTGRKHFWSACVVERPKNLKKLSENMETYKPEGDFSEEEIIQFKTDLTGIFPINLVINLETIEKLKEKFVPPISEFDEELQLCWFIPRKVTERKTKNGKLYWVLEVIDSNNELTRIRCWGVKPHDSVQVNRPYMSRLNYDPDWGFSTRSIRHNFRLLG
ncbi:MAG: DNA polymerase III subunit alpha [Candidatus Jacksonbacteria bacterium]|nr:DNA polymerase III subunit alpha [Candidatus Jacksonbacteria bacterium]